MSDAEIERIFRSLDRIEARLVKLEQLEAQRQGASETKTSMARLVFGAAGMAAAISAVIAFVMDRI